MSNFQGGHCSHVKENTLASMRDAVLHGDLFIKFVKLTPN